MASVIRFQRLDGMEAQGWHDGPANGPGVVLIQEWWGLNDQIKGVGAKLVALGYRVLIPDLYRGKVTLEAAEAAHLMSGLDFADAATQDVRGAVQYLKQGSPKVAAVGYCLGGVLAILAAMKVPELDAAVPFYGAPHGMAEEAGSVRIPVLGHFGLQDVAFPPEMVREYETQMKQGGTDVTFHWYDADHAFCNETIGAFDQEACELAWQRTVDFLGKHLTS